ncbi:MAG: hypothetical protein WDZ35_04780 [Crocinitomicaceae bacterium]
MVEERSQYKVKTDKFEGYLMAPDILYLHYFYNQEIGVAEIQLGFELHEKHELDENIKRLVHCEKFVSITRAARELVQNHGKPAKAEAYVIPFLSQKILFNLHIKLRKRKHPIKAFDQLDEALHWLNTFSDASNN